MLRDQKQSSPIVFCRQLHRLSIPASLLSHTRILACTTARRAEAALPGADDPRYVHTDAFGVPTENMLIFARAEAREPISAGQKLPDHANSPDETQIQYDLYRMPFNDGKGGQPVAIEGFPQRHEQQLSKVSPMAAGSSL